MLKMLYPTSLGRKTAKAALVKEKKAKKGHQKFLAMKGFRRTEDLLHKGGRYTQDYAYSRYRNNLSSHTIVV